MDCSKSDSVIVSYIDPSTDAILDLGWRSPVEILEVSLECYPNGAAGGTNEVSVCMHACMASIYTLYVCGGIKCLSSPFLGSAQ